MFRVNRAAPRRIQAGTENGLHCGNVPLFCNVSIRTSGVRFRHFGYMRAQDRARKLDRYRRLTEMVLSENPHDVGAWVTLGLFYANEGATLAHLECLQRAMMSAVHGEYLAHYEAGKLYLRLAQAAISEAESRMGGHPDRKVAQAMLDFLERAAPPVPRTGLVAAGLREGLSDAEALASLPDWPGPPATS